MPDAIEAVGIALAVVDAHELDEAARACLRPGERLAARDGVEHRLPRWFYRVDSREEARATRLAEHFTLAELLEVDVREAARARTYPRYVPCAVVLLAAHLELLRQAAGTFVFVSANGGYRSPGHRLSVHASPHCWGTAANVYRIGDELLDTRERIERWAALAIRVAPGLWARPWGGGPGEADDHLHLDLGYLVVTPREREEEGCP